MCKFPPNNQVTNGSKIWYEQNATRGHNASVFLNFVALVVPTGQHYFAFILFHICNIEVLQIKVVDFNVIYILSNVPRFCTINLFLKEIGRFRFQLHAKQERILSSIN
jgi:hypothetical protein